MSRSAPTGADRVPDVSSDSSGDPGKRWSPGDESGRGLEVGGEVGGRGLPQGEDAADAEHAAGGDDDRDRDGAASAGEDRREDEGRDAAAEAGDLVAERGAGVAGSGGEQFGVKRGEGPVPGGVDDTLTEDDGEGGRQGGASVALREGREAEEAIPGGAPKGDRL